MGGMLEDRGKPQYPVKLRRAYWMMRRSGSVSVAGWKCSSGAEVYGLSSLPKLLLVIRQRR